jgi:hypothetical protein
VRLEYRSGPGAQYLRDPGPDRGSAHAPRRRTAR